MLDVSPRIGMNKMNMICEDMPAEIGKAMQMNYTIQLILLT